MILGFIPPETYKEQIVFFSKIPIAAENSSFVAMGMFFSGISPLQIL
jgi:hypothetical protein